MVVGACDNPKEHTKDPVSTALTFVCYRHARTLTTRRQRDEPSPPAARCHVRTGIGMSRQPQLWCAWCGPAMLVLFVLGFIVLAGWVPPPAPTDSAEQIAAMFREDTTAIRIGMFITMLSMSLMAPFGVAIAAQTRRMERGTPVLTWVSIVCLAVGTLVIVLSTVVWAVAAFRPIAREPDTILALNDLGWFLFLIEWPPFSIWFIAVAAAILRDPHAESIFPRWSAYLSLWAALVFVAAGLIMFFKNGPFAWNGLLAFYAAVAIFFVWLVTMTALVIRAVRRESEDRVPQASIAATAPA